MGQQEKLGKGPSGRDRHIFEETGKEKKKVLISTILNIYFKNT